MRENQGLQTDNRKIVKGEPRKGLMIAIAVDVLLVIIVIIVAGIHYESITTFSSGSQTLVSAQTIELHGQNDFVVGFTLYSNMTNISIRGAFTSNESVYFSLMTANEFELLSQNRSLISSPYAYVWSAGNITEGNISIPISAPSIYLPPVGYYVMFYNAYPYLNSDHAQNIARINVTSSIVLTYEFQNSHYKANL